MHIGEYHLNEDEKGWTKKYIEDCYVKCAKEMTAALNKKINPEHVKKLLCPREQKKESKPEKKEKKTNKRGY